MTSPNIFFRLAKVNIAERTVEGIATAEVVDKSGEICDYASTVPYYKAWSEGFKKATDGKSLGNIRAMHGNTAAGKVVSMVCDDEKKEIYIKAKIVDANEWNKIVEGVYTGFSQGGEYVKQWKDGEYTRYTANPSEISIVDNPCLGTATFEVIKADGATELRKFDVRKIASKRLEQTWTATDGFSHVDKQEVIKHQAKIDADELAAPAHAAIAALNKKLDAAPMYWEVESFNSDLISEALKKGQLDPSVTEIEKKKFSEAKRKEMAARGEAMTDGSFPIESAQDVKNAVHDWGRTGSRSDVKSHIMTRAKAVGAEESLPDDWKKKEKVFSLVTLEKAQVMVKELHKFACGEIMDARCALNICADLTYLIFREEMEVMRGDSEDQAQVTMLAEAVVKIKEFVISELQETEDEVAEILVIACAAGADADLIKADPKFAAILSKRGRHSKADAARIAEMHDHMEDMGDHMQKMRKAHKAMMDTHEKMGETTHADHHADMGSHLKKAEKHMNAMDKSHGDMGMCMKGLGVSSEGNGGQNGRTPNDPQKAEHAEALQKAQADADALRGTVGTLSDTIEKLGKRLEQIEAQPAVDTKKPAVFAVGKDNEPVNKAEDSAVDVSRQVFGSGVSPQDARRQS